MPYDIVRDAINTEVIRPMSRLTQQDVKNSLRGKWMCAREQSVIRGLAHKRIL